MNRPRIEIKVLRRIAWEHWDPIGLGDIHGNPPQGAEDDYDSYVMRAAGMLVNGKTVASVASYLSEIEANHMGLGRSNMEASLKSVNEIRKCLLNIGYKNV